MKKILGFTLAETLITMSIIGVVAALVIPGFIARADEKAWSKSKYVFEMKINEAMNQMKTAEKLTGYETNEDFVNEFKNYLKISKICDANHLTECFSEETFTYGDETVAVNDLKTGVDLGKDTYTDPLVGVRLINGTTAIIAYDPSCSWITPFDNQNTGIGCLTMLYDINGSSKPNTYNKDIYSIGAINISTVPGNCLTKEFYKKTGICTTAPASIISSLTLADCTANKNQWGIIMCENDNNDWFGGAVKACGGVSKLATSVQMGKIAEYIYGDGCTASTQPTNTFAGCTYSTVTSDMLTRAQEFGITTSQNFWVSDGAGANSWAYYRGIGLTSGNVQTGWFTNDRGSGSGIKYGICVDNN